MLRSYIPRFKTHLALFGVTLVVSVVITCLWVLSEQDFYHGDAGRTHKMAVDQAALFREWPGGALYYHVKESLVNDYNDLVVLPVLPVVLAFGDSRLVFELAMVLLYQLPFALVIGAIATKLIPVRPAAVFWSATGLALLTPALWVSTLRGLPDAGSAFLIAAAILVYLHDRRLGRWWQIPLMGLALATAVVLRRHFAYGVVALFVAWGVMSFSVFLEQRQRPLRETARSWFTTILRIGLVGVCSLAWLAILAWPFLETVYRTNFASLYTSYVFPALEVITYYILIFGWGPWVLAAVGYIAGVLSGRVNRTVAGFLGVFALAMYVLWAHAVGMKAIHFANHFILFVVLGLAALVWVVWQTFQSRSRQLILASIGLYLSANAVIGMVKLTDLDSPGVGNIATSFAPNHSPIVRKDYGETGRLVEYLRQVTSRTDLIYVAASSFILDLSVLANAERALYGRDQARLSFIATPVVDSNHDLPLSGLLKAKYVVVPSAFEVQQAAGASQWEYQIRHDQQTVVKVASQSFTENWPIANDFARLPTEFTLSNGTGVSVYRRIRATSQETALATLEMMEQSFRSRPGGRLDWVVLGATVSHLLSRNDDGVHAFETDAHDPGKHWEAKLLYAGEVAENPRISGALRFADPSCTSNVTLSISAMSPSHRVLDTRTTTLRYPESPAFAVEMGTLGVKYFVLRFSGSAERPAGAVCQFKLSLNQGERDQGRLARSASVVPVLSVPMPTLPVSPALSW